jgi:hypothetical protein
MGFRSLQHMRDRRSTIAGFPSPATFRPQGLVTLSTAYSLRARAGFVSHRQRSWDSPFGAFTCRKVRGRFRTHEPACRFSRRCYRRRGRRSGSTGRDFRALTLAGVPGDDMGLACRALVAPWGFFPSRVCERGPWPGFLPTSSHALCRHAQGHFGRRLRVSIGSRRASPRNRGEPQRRVRQPL